MLTILNIAGLLVGLSLLGGIIGAGLSLWSDKRKRKKEEKEKER
jgi:hypothetical protein